MKMLRCAHAFVAVLALSISPFVSAGDKEKEKQDIDRILSAAREESRVMEHLDHLSNRIGSRLTSSDALTTAGEWAVDRFKSFGIENAHLEKWGEFPVGFNRGPSSGRMVEPEVKLLTFGTNSWTAGTKGVAKGKAILAPKNEDELAKVKDSLPGAWILVPAGTIFRPNGGGAVPSDFRKKLDEAYAEAKIAGYVRPTRGDLILTAGAYRVDWEKLPTIPSINLRKDDYDAVVKKIKDVQAAKEANKDAKDIKDVVLEFDVRNYFKKGPIPLYNVIADIPGTEFPDEYVIVGGHLDSWDGATGTCDNGTGCSTTLEAARLLMKTGIKPRRTIRFMLWSGEEQGLMGSHAYIKAHADLMKNISAVLVHDGGTNYLSGIVATKTMKADFDGVFASVLTLDEKMPFAVREVGGLPRGIGSDHDSFLGAGVPGFFWNQSGKANYNRIHHTQYDTYDDAIPEYQKHSAIIVAVGAYGVAGLDHLLSRESLIAAGGGRGGAGSPRRLLGLQLEELKIIEVIEGGLAIKAGIKANDEIVKVGDKAVTSREEFTTAIQAGDALKKITVKRDGKEIEFSITFPAQPGSPIPPPVPVTPAKP